MYIGIDTGASKTLIASFDDAGTITKQLKFVTPEDFSDYQVELLSQLKKLMGSRKPTAIGIALPGAINGEVFVHGGNLKWDGVNIVEPLKAKYKIPIALDNDANLAGLAEAKLGAAKDYKVVLYITLSTGVGTAIIVDGKIEAPLSKSEGGQVIIQSHHKKLMRLEDMVSGKAMEERFGKPGYDINDMGIWDDYASDLAVGIIDMLTLVPADVVVLGGGMAVHFQAFGGQLKRYLKELDPGFYPLPPVKQAEFVETAVIYGCYIAAKAAKH